MTNSSKQLPMTAVQGWWRLAGHFLIWAALPNLVSYGLYSFGVSNVWLALVGPAMLFMFVLGTLIAEAVEWRGKKQTGWKAALDFTSKVLGFAVGITTWMWWWF